MGRTEDKVREPWRKRRKREELKFSVFSSTRHLQGEHWAKALHFCTFTSYFWWLVLQAWSLSSLFPKVFPKIIEGLAQPGHTFCRHSTESSVEASRAIAGENS